MRVKNPHHLHGVHPVLVQVVYVVAQAFPLQVIEGVRSKERQRKLFDSGASKTLNSYHLVQPFTGYGHAVDVAPLIDGPLNWEDLHEFYLMIGAFRAIAKEWRVPIVSGRNWDDDDSWTDNNFQDFPHLQIARNYPVLPGYVTGESGYGAHT